MDLASTLIGDINITKKTYSRYIEILTASLLSGIGDIKLVIVSFYLKLNNP